MGMVGWFRYQRGGQIRLGNVKRLTQTQCVYILGIFQHPFAFAHRIGTYKTPVPVILHDNIQYRVSQTLRCSHLSHMHAANIKYVSRRIMAPPPFSTHKHADTCKHYFAHSPDL